MECDLSRLGRIRETVMPALQIALIGYGKMGRAIDGEAIEGTILCRIDPSLETSEINAETIGKADVCIDFSHPDAVIDNLKKIAKCGKNVVIGTTGWYHELDEVRKIADQYRIGIIYAPNFSVGVHIFTQIIREASRIINSIPGYDVGIIDTHHNKKVDAPSGTAITLRQVISSQLDRTEREIPITSLRCGNIPGTHEVIFDSLIDTITLTHSARNRLGFAKGALLAAQWIVGKKGLYTLDDML